MSETHKYNSFIAFCKSHLEQQEDEFTYVFQDTDFVVKVQPIWPFVLNYARIRNRTDEITRVLESLDQYRGNDIMASFIRLSPEFSDILTANITRGGSYTDSDDNWCKITYYHYTSNKTNHVGLRLVLYK